jgi:hypothetical protein
MTNYRKLSSQAEAEIEALRNEGVILSDSDIISINALCWEIESPSKRVSLAKGKPIKCGNVWLWPRTIHACEWYSDIGCEMSNPEKSLAYCMAHRDTELFTVTEKQVNAWFKTIRATLAEIRVCIYEIISLEFRDTIPSKKNDGFTISKLAQMMVAKFGGSFEMWERQCSIDYVFNFIDTQAKQDEAEAKKTHIEKATIILGRFTQSLLKRHKANVR